MKVQVDTLISLTASFNCNVVLNVATGVLEVILSSLPLPIDPMKLICQPFYGPPFPPIETECSSPSHGRHKSSVNDPSSQEIESVGERRLRVL